MFYLVLTLFMNVNLTTSRAGLERERFFKGTVSAASPWRMNFSHFKNVGAWAVASCARGVVWGGCGGCIKRVNNFSGKQRGARGRIICVLPPPCSARQTRVELLCGFRFAETVKKSRKIAKRRIYGKCFVPIRARISPRDLRGSAGRTNKTNIPNNWNNVWRTHVCRRACVHVYII